jgi:hypothetical protein
LEWIGAVIADLRAGRLVWDVADIFRHLREAAATSPKTEGVNAR